jgi:hypothetical protein
VIAALQGAGIACPAGYMQTLFPLNTSPQPFRYFVVFEKDISYWEKALAHISETVEMILQASADAEAGAWIGIQQPCYTA